MKTSLIKAGAICGGSAYNPNYGANHLSFSRMRLKMPSNSRHVCCQRSWRLFSEPRDDENDLKPQNPKPNDGVDPIIILPYITLACIAALIAGVFYAKANNPNTYFDIDFYMALDGVIGNTAATADSPESIVGLPPLSPAEQLVGALFGPPSR